MTMLAGKCHIFSGAIGLCLLLCGSVAQAQIVDSIRLGVVGHNIEVLGTGNGGKEDRPILFRAGHRFSETVGACGHIESTAFPNRNLIHTWREMLWSGSRTDFITCK